MSSGSPQGQPFTDAVLLGRPVRLHLNTDPEALRRTIDLVEQTFRDMDKAYEVTWGCPPSALDTTTWLLLGILNLAHRTVGLEQEAARRTQDLENTLSKLLDDVPDDPPSHGHLFNGEADD